ncbi:hypothetical protein AKJ09_08862 [Labilithrix luteola]|uniref:NHL repeat domain protein n=1 Tax=Labilithrix luteola TaxID=1391654 RepID=A0A0K1Q8Y4_9BACT|nr:hypothetical protein [Labilithrix luteola]AKV02199.1 hypothetical protein AKJ09_08862 [Labilithrix luteola]
MRSIFMTSLAATLVAFTVTACGGDASSEDTTTEGTSAVEQSLGWKHGGAILPRLPSTPTVSASTVPENGDVNPYGVAFVPDDFPRGGILRKGDVIVSNFNNSGNLQGTGTTIVRVNANASPSLFFQDPATPGLSTALGVLERGFVVVGNVPSTDGSGVCTEGPNGEMENVGNGSLLFIDRKGNIVKTFTSKKFLQGPWDLTIKDEGSRAKIFVSNVLSGTVTRLDVRIDGDRDSQCDDDNDDNDDNGDDNDNGDRNRKFKFKGKRRIVIEKETVIASGYLHRCDSAAFVIGPTGLALDEKRDILYVASTGDNTIFAIRDASDRRHDAGMGEPIVTDPVHLHGPLALARARNGNLISSQGDAINPDPAQPSEIVEFTAKGEFVAQFPIDPSSGSAFGLALDERHHKVRLAAVDDAPTANTLNIFVAK